MRDRAWRELDELRKTLVINMRDKFKGDLRKHFWMLI